MSFNKSLFIAIFGTLMIFSSCKDDDGSVNIKFKLYYGSQPLEMFKNYSYPVTGEAFNFSRISFFISDLKLISSDGDVLLKDIDYLNLTNAHSSPVNPNGFEYKIKGIKPSSFTGIDFNIGIPADLNAKEPKDFNSSNVLSDQAEYWYSWKSYIYFKPEGYVTLAGESKPETPFALHLGGDTAFRSIHLTKSISISENAETQIDVIIDMEKFFNGSTLYDIQDTQQIHSLFQLPLITKLADNLVSGIK